MKKGDLVRVIPVPDPNMYIPANQEHFASKYIRLGWLNDSKATYVEIGAVGLLVELGSKDSQVLMEDNVWDIPTRCLMKC